MHYIKDQRKWNPEALSRTRIPLWSSGWPAASLHEIIARVIPSTFLIKVMQLAYHLKRSCCSCTTPTCCNYPLSSLLIVSILADRVPFVDRTGFLGLIFYPPLYQKPSPLNAFSEDDLPRLDCSAPFRMNTIRAWTTFIRSHYYDPPRLTSISPNSRHLIGFIQQSKPPISIPWRHITYFLSPTLWNRQDVIPEKYV